MFKLFKKQEPEPKQENQIVIPVRDIKHYLVAEYEKVKMLNKRLEELDDDLEKAKEVELKYQATLVTLEEFDSRLKRKDTEIDKLRSRIADKDEQIREISDDLNNHKIMLNQVGITKKEIIEGVRDEFATELVDVIENLKGHLAKQQVIDIIKNPNNQPYSSKEIEGGEME